MGGASGIAVTLALGSGLAGAVQVAVMGRFGERIGTWEALTFSLLLSTLLALAALLLARRGLGGLGGALTAPKWLWLGGLMGAFVVLSITVAGPSIGTTATIGLLIAGQLVAATAIDRFGWFGFERIPVSWPRALGLVLLAVGAALTIRR
jgi:bacterial/archaeal transporter family-2 protein